METILIVDDEEEIQNLLKIYLSNENYRVIVCGNGKSALAHLKRERVDLAILDVMLPDEDGFILCRKIREEHYFPIIMLTAKNEEGDLLAGLTMGADDYITKPFRPMELMARVRTQLRRYTKYNQTEQSEEGMPQVSDVIDIRGLYMKESTHEASLYEKELELTPLEFSILFYLGRRQGQVVSSEELFEAVWGESYMDSNNTVMTHIGRIREKLKESAKHPKFIKTVWGVGYKIE
ncbi:MAG: VanR-ABDEGLN family response regulator transcription factor [Lachnospiraceae bacterium]|nr:VanR-ABDEGLN family response regulator transcription factor [Lachnospiraceae bacterium]